MTPRFSGITCFHRLNFGFTSPLTIISPLITIATSHRFSNKTDSNPYCYSHSIHHRHLHRHHMSASVSSFSATPVADAIEEKLRTQLQPSYLQIINESSNHNVPPGSESHFKVIVVTDQFIGLSLLHRHRLIHNILTAELQSLVHALSIVAKTREQWNDNQQITDSPACRGGKKHEQHLNLDKQQQQQQ